MRNSVPVGVRLPSDLVDELDELAVFQAKAASDAANVPLTVNRSRTVRALILLGLDAVRKREARD